ncbi:MAG TPA: hypothetical protein VGJ26_08900 [Pirellulales bacterium]|jgi:hypothetical protein
MRNRQRWIFAAGLVACGWLTAQLSYPSPADAQNETKDKQKQDSKEEVNVRYAQAYVKLMETEIAKLQFSNRAVASTIRPAVIEAAQVALRDAQDRVKLAQKNDDIPDHEIYVQGAKSYLTYSQESLRKAEEANLKYGGTVSAVEMARLKAQLEVAKTRVEVAQNLAGESALMQAQYELELLREQVQQLQITVLLLRDRN